MIRISPESAPISRAQNWLNRSALAGILPESETDNREKKDPIGLRASVVQPSGLGLVERTIAWLTALPAGPGQDWENLNRNALAFIKPRPFA